MDNEEKIKEYEAHKAPVPSYDEWQQLKEILYKCREKLDRLDYGCEVWAGELTGFIEEIDNAIGEKR